MATSAGYGEDLFNFVEILQSEETFLVARGSDCFSLRLVTFHKVLHGLELLWSDTLTGPELIVAKFLTLVAEYIASTLTSKINSFIILCLFSGICKMADITCTSSLS